MKKFINKISLACALALFLIPLKGPANAAAIDLSVNNPIDACAFIDPLEDLNILTFNDVTIAKDDVRVFNISFKSEIEKVVTAKNTGNPVAGICPVLDPIFLKFHGKFISFIDETFKNGASTTSLSNVAIAEYYNYRKRLRDTCGLYKYYITKKLYPKPDCAKNGAGNPLCFPVEELGAETVYKDGVAKFFYPNNEIGDSYYVLQDCRNLLSSYEIKAADIMKKHMKANVIQKRAMILIEKLRAINGQMRDLSMKISQVYSYAKTFCSKLPFKTDAPSLGGGG